MQGRRAAFGVGDPSSVSALSHQAEPWLDREPADDVNDKRGLHVPSSSHHDAPRDGVGGKDSTVVSSSD